MIEEQNEKNESLKMELNRWADYVDTDIPIMPPPINPIEEEGFLNKLQPYPQHLLAETADLPKRKNWVEEGFITPVKTTDKECFPSSYAFATADIVEFLYKK